MIKITSKLLFISAIGFSTATNAQWSASGGYAHFDNTGLGMMHVGVGYEYQQGDWFLMPELRAGIGVIDGDLEGLAGFIGSSESIELDSYFSASVRAGYKVTESFSVFLQPAYTRTEFTSSGGGESASASDNESYVGIGASYSFSKSFKVEVARESIASDDLFFLTGRYKF
jgi:outer membrane protease